MEINGRYGVTVYTINMPNLRSRRNVDGIGLASGLHTVHVCGYGRQRIFQNLMCDG
jgi:hypothetical protein